MDISVYDFLSLFTEEEEQKFTLFSLDEEKGIYTGYEADLPHEYGVLWVESIDTMWGPTDTIVLNVSARED